MPTSRRPMGRSTRSSRLTAGSFGRRRRRSSSPDGQVVAKAGDIVTVHGSEADMMSICQIGPIIQATDIVAGG